LNRKDRRKAAKLARKSGNDDLDKKLAIASSLADECDACQKSFDKSNIEMLDSWIVVVRESLPRLYCPPCWEHAMSIIENSESV
jgi:hypothetical protein